MKQGFYLRVCSLYEVVSDCWDGLYDDISRVSIAAIVLTLVYVVSPIDTLPDFVPLVGLLDDAAVVSLCLSAIRGEMVKHERWQLRNEAGVPVGTACGDEQKTV